MAQEGTGALKGRVWDPSGQPLTGVQVEVVGAGLTTQTKRDGSFEFRVPAGSYVLKASKKGLSTASRRIKIRVGNQVEEDLSLSTEQEEDSAFAEDEEIEEVQIWGALRAESKTAALDKRFEASSVQETYSQEEIQQSTASDVADVVAKVPSVSVRDNFAYVRGLGEKYGQTLLNGSNLPSPEPDKREVPLDLFPSNLVESIVIAKTYSPDTPGNFGGGSVQIHTKGIPSENFFKLGLDLKYNSQTTFKDFKTYEGGNYDAFTFDDGIRELPDTVPQRPVKVGDPERFLTEEEVQFIGRSFENIWNPQTITAPPNFKLKASFGQRFESDDWGTLGYIGAVNWGNKYQTVKEETFRVLKNFGTIEDPDPQVFSDYEFDTYTFESELSGMLNLTWEVNEGQKVGVRNLLTRTMEDRLRLQEGLDGQQDREIRVTDLRNTERSLFVTQAFGEHLLIGDIFAEWRQSYALSQRDEPDRRRVRYDFRPVRNDFVLEDVGTSGARDFYQLDENIYDGALDFSIPFHIFVDPPKTDLSVKPDQKIKFGGAYTFRDRDFDARRFRFRRPGVPVDELGNRVDLTSPAETIFRPQNINPDGFELNEETSPTDNYEAEQLVLAGYGMVDFKLFESPLFDTGDFTSLRLQAGARIEKSDQEVTTFELFGDPPEEVLSELDETDVLPSATLTWQIMSAMNLRLAASRTVTRPEFRELAPFQFEDVTGGFIRKGNPDLDRTRIEHFDLRWEWSPFPGDLLSASLFYKDFDKPIEQIIIPTGSALLSSWENADSAELQGFEIEVRKNLGSLYDLFCLIGGGPPLTESAVRDVLSDFTLNFNYAWIDSEVEIEEDTLVVSTSNKRPLQGQPEFVFNVGLVYDSRDLGLTTGVFLNRFGENITQVGAFGVPDEKEQPRWDMDVSLSKKVGENGSFKFTIENLLNDEFILEQGDEETRKFKRGVTWGISYSHSF